jgi:hypothetical protein
MKVCFDFERYPLSTSKTSPACRGFSTDVQTLELSAKRSTFDADPEANDETIHRRDQTVRFRPIRSMGRDMGRQTANLRKH